MCYNIYPNLTELFQSSPTKLKFEHVTENTSRTQHKPKSNATYWCLNKCHQTPLLSVSSNYEMVTIDLQPTNYYTELFKKKKIKKKYFHN